MAEENTNNKIDDKTETKITKDISDIFKNKNLFVLSSYLYNLSYLLYFIVIILLSITYWKTHLGEDAKFQTYIQVLMAATIIMTVYSVYLQQVTFRETTSYNQLNNFDENFKALFDGTLKFFIDNPEMNYYYEELFYNKTIYKEEDRNKNLETQYTLIILSRVSNIIYSFYIYGNKFLEKNERIAQSEVTLKNILDSFFGSKIFVENWEKYKKGLATPITKQYIKENFNK
jgi:hypothetical protein